MDDENEIEHSYPWSWRATLVMLGDYASDIIHATAGFVDNVTVAVAAAHNYRINRELFAQSAALELEMLVAGEEED